nr:MAG TPA: hypothetical protein [Caudoviricetes sp.]
MSSRMGVRQRSRISMLLPSFQTFQSYRPAICR